MSVLVSERDATRNMTGVLQALQALPPSEVAQKRRALQAVRDAFVMRRGSSPARPSAAEYILDEACQAAQLYSNQSVRESPTEAQNGLAAERMYAQMIVEKSERRHAQLARCFLQVGK